MTFSLLGRCARTGMLGCAVASSSVAVAARCAHARSQVGAAATEGLTDPRLGPRLLDALERGAAALDALTEVAGSADHLEYRQLTVIDGRGVTAYRSGAHTPGVHGIAEGFDCVAAGSLLADRGVVDALALAFERDPAAHLGERLVAALAAGRAAGGEQMPLRSAGLLVVDRVEWPVVDLRVDLHDDPIGELAALWSLCRQELDEHVRIALDPASARGAGTAEER